MEGNVNAKKHQKRRPRSEETMTEKCKKCGWLVACDECSKKYSEIDIELKAKGI